MACSKLSKLSMQQKNKLSEFKICEDGFVPMPLTPSSVVCVGSWGNNKGLWAIKKVIRKQRLHPSAFGLTNDGIGVTFPRVYDAAIFRLFFPGETMTGH